MPEIEATKSYKPTKQSTLITWGPVAAVLITIGIYISSQVLGSMVLAFYAGVQGWSKEFIEAWQEGVWPQFWYVLIVEAVSLGLLWQFLKRRKANFKTLGLIKPKLIDVAYTLLGFGIYFPILIAVTLAIKAWVPQINFDQQQQLGFTNTHGPELILVFISLVILPPIAEELMVRGFLYLGLKSRMKTFLAALITGLLFGAAHLQLGSGAPLLWTAAIDTFILSWVLILLREMSGGLCASIGLHMLKNMLAFLALFIFVK